MKAIAVFTSSGGSNFKSIYNNTLNGKIQNTKVVLLVSNNPKSRAVLFAKDQGIDTFILNANNSVPKIFSSKKKTIGIRIPNHPVALEMINQLGAPLISSSIKDNDEIIEYNTDAEVLYEEFGDQVDLVVDGGYGDNQVSTIVNCVNDDIEILRQGKGILEW